MNRFDIELVGAIARKVSHNLYLCINPPRARKRTAVSLLMTLWEGQHTRQSSL